VVQVDDWAAHAPDTSAVRQAVSLEDVGTINLLEGKDNAAATNVDTSAPVKQVVDLDAAPESADATSATGVKTQVVDIPAQEPAQDAVSEAAASVADDLKDAGKVAAST
jgi:hypothetical protein